MKKINLNICLNLIFIFIFSTHIFGNQNELNNLNTTEDSLYLKKTGGLCFRYDDNSKISEYMKLAEIFKKYNANFSISLNLNDFKYPEYKDSIRILQEMGHEIMDHTPNHRTNYFKTVFPIADYYSDSDNKLIDGLDHISNNKVCLEFQDVDTNLAINSGTCSISQNVIYGDFTKIAAVDLYFYFPKINKLVYAKEFNENSIKFLDVWEDPISLGTIDQTKYFTFSKSNVHITNDAVKVLTNESLKLAAEFRLNRPYSWIQPGGTHPELTKIQLKETIGDELGFIAGTGGEKGRQVYNEKDEFGYERFEMQWGDFFDDTWTLDKCKNVIADRTAKHYMQISHSHLYDIDSVDQYFSKLDSLLAWATENNIPIRTYSEWAEILYDKETDPYFNVIPPLEIDKDKNVYELDLLGVPDGYMNRFWAGQGSLEIDTTINGENKYCYSVKTDARICKIENLAGIEKGNNDFKIKTKGEIGDSIEVRISFGEYNYNVDKTYKFPANTESWVEYTLEESTNGNTELFIPDSVTFISIDIFCTDYVAGHVKVKDLYLAKSKLTDIEEITETIKDQFELLQNYPNPFNPETKISYILSTSADVTLKIYDILGREISTLIKENQNPGNYEINFNASKLSSGFYFYTLKAGNNFQTKKMLLIK